MAWILKAEKAWYCYIHIPKTAGNWVRSTFVDLGLWTTREPMGWTAPSAHGMPDRWDYPLIFSVVREPADWLRSAWGSRMIDGWRPHPERVAWSSFCGMVDQYRSDSFAEFADGVTTNLPGVVGWLFDSYTPPPVKVLRLGPELNDFIKELGGDPDIPPENVDKTHGMEVSDNIRKMVYKAEHLTYIRYGFKEDGDYYE